MKIATYLPAINRWIHHEYTFTIEGAGIFRIVYVLYCFFISGIPNFSRASYNPDFMYNPSVGLGSLIRSIPSYGFLESLEIILWILHLNLLFGYKTKWVCLGITFFMIIGRTFIYAFGFIDHYIVADVFPAIMAFSGWGLAYSIDGKNSKADDEKNNWPMAMIALTLGFAMFTTGILKVIGGWLYLNTPAAYGHMLYHYLSYHTMLLAHSLLAMKWPWFWELADYVTVFLELGLIFTIGHRKWFLQALFLFLLFHLFNILFLNIAFLIHYIIYLAYLPWDKYHNSDSRFYRWCHLITTKRNLFVTICLVLLYKLFYFNPVFSSSKTTSIVAIFPGNDTYIAWMNLLIVICTLIFFMFTLYLKPPSDRLHIKIKPEQQALS